MPCNAVSIRQAPGYRPLRQTGEATTKYGAGGEFPVPDSGPPALEFVSNHGTGPIPWGCHNKVGDSPGAPGCGARQSY